MEANLLTVKFGGEWKLEDGDLVFAGDVSSKVIVIRQTVTLDEMKCEILNRFTTSDNLSPTLQFSHLHPFKKTTEPFSIENDTDLRSFLQINELKEVNWTLPLYVTAAKEITEEQVTESIHDENQLALQAYSSAKVTNVMEEDFDVQYEDVECINGGCDMDGKGDDTGIESHISGSSMSTKYTAPPISERSREILIFLGQLFRTKEDLKNTVELLAAQEMFAYKVKKSTPCYYRIVCVDGSCTWKIHGAIVGGSTVFIIKKYFKEHTCSMEVRIGKQRPINYRIIAERIKHSFVDEKQGPTPRQIRNTMRNDFKQNVSYWKSWMARDFAMEMTMGTAEENYKLVPSYCWVLKQANPGTVTFIEVDSNSKFKYVFIAFGPCIRAFPILRKVLVVDGTFLKGKYGGTLLTASAQDANHQIYPIAFAVVDSENNASWEWFFNKLATVIPSSEELVFVSDRHQSIARALELIYPNAKHYYCRWHLKQNIMAKFKKNILCQWFESAANSYTEDDFNSYFGCISNTNSKMEKYLEELQFEKWSRAYSKGDRYNMMTSNNAESLNNVFGLDRSFPIIGLLNAVREKITKWFNERRNESENNSFELPNKISDIVYIRCSDAGMYAVKHLNKFQFEVVGGMKRVMVDLKENSCSCKVFDYEKIPCVHALAVIRDKKLSVLRYISSYYKIEAWKLAYHETIYPALNEEQWVVPEDIKRQKCHPPMIRKRCGRPQKKRKPSAGEIRGKASKRIHNS